MPPHRNGEAEDRRKKNCKLTRRPLIWHTIGRLIHCRYCRRRILMDMFGRTKCLRTHTRSTHCHIAHWPPHLIEDGVEPATTDQSISSHLIIRSTFAYPDLSAFGWIAQNKCSQSCGSTELRSLSFIRSFTHSLVRRMGRCVNWTVSSECVMCIEKFFHLFDRCEYSFFLFSHFTTISIHWN